VANQLASRYGAGPVGAAAILLGLLLIAAGWATAAEPAAGEAAGAGLPTTFTVADIALGDHASGEELTAESLQHRVVLLLFWNRDEDKSVAVLPILEQMHRGLAPGGLLAVAAHLGRGSSVELNGDAEKQGATYAFVTEANVKGMEFPPLPHALLFDHTGQCVARGSLGELAGKAQAAVRAAPPLVLAGRHLETLAPLEKMLRDEAKFGAVLRKAEAAREDEATSEEATFVIERLTAHAEQLLSKAETAKPTDAIAAAGLLQRVANAYRGQEVGKKAVELQREWKRDKQFTDGLQAASVAAQLEALRSQAIAQASGPSRSRYPGRPGQQPAAPKSVTMAVAGRIPPQVKAQMAQLAGMVRQLHPGSKYADRAEAIAVELGLTLPAAP
jgi:hypothetical protein